MPICHYAPVGNLGRGEVSPLRKAFGLVDQAPPFLVGIDPVCDRDGVWVDDRVFVGMGAHLIWRRLCVVRYDRAMRRLWSRDVMFVLVGPRWCQQQEPNAQCCW